MTFEINIGDWSKDGHGQSDRFIVSSNKTVEEIREGIYSSLEKYPELKFDEIAVKYNEGRISPKQLKIARELGYTGFFEEEEEDREDGPWMDPNQCAEMTLWFAQLSLPDMTYEFKDQGLPTLEHYGSDKKGRHLKLPGYGCRCYVL